MKTYAMKVLICTDYSEYTQRILEGAQMLLAGRIPVAEITVLYVIDETLLSAGSGAEPQIMESLQDNGRLINKMAQQYLGNEVKYLEEYGIPRVVIDQVIDSNPYDLIIFGTHGRSGISKLLFGSEAQHLLQHVKTPMLIIP